MTISRQSFPIIWLFLLLATLSACQPDPDSNLQDPKNPANTAGLDGEALGAIETAAATQIIRDEPGGEVAAPPSPTPLTDYPGSAAGAATPTVQPYPYPGPTEPIPTRDQPSTPGNSESVYLPLTGRAAGTATPQPPGSPTPVPTVDFTAVSAELEAGGQSLGFAKIGFHVTLLEDRTILDDWMKRLDEAGVPIFIKTVDNAEPLFQVQELMKVSGVPHVLVFRSSGSVPLYELPPAQAALLHWTEHKEKFPPELDPNLVWVETLNEPDRTKPEWLGQFAQETARLAMADGFRWAAFGWASGEPEPEQWQSPAMLSFLQMAAANPEQIAIAVHEYSYITDDIAHDYPYKVGRFQEIFRIADQYGFPRPTVLITEWGWEYADIPSIEQAMDHIDWAAALYAPYPQVKGAAIWNLGVGCCYGDISEQVQEIIEPLTAYNLTNYFTIPQAPNQQPIDPALFQP